MAEAKDKGAKGAPVPFPPTWNKMTVAQKREWQAKNRPSLSGGKPAEPAKQPAPVQPGGAEMHTNAEMGAAHEYNAANEYNARHAPHEPTDQELAEGAAGMASEIDPRAALVRILRALADAFELQG